MQTRKKTKRGSESKVTRYTYDEVKEPRTPETGHTALLPTDEQVVELVMDNGWSKALSVGTLDPARPVVIDMDPSADPVMFWSGKRNSRAVPLLPLQRNEIVSGSRIAQIIERTRAAASEKQPRQDWLFAELEKQLRESDRARRVEFYTHDEGWKNKLICGDSLHVMESLMQYEGLREKVQTIYMDPPYGIKYDSNFQQRIDSTKNDDNDQADDILTIKAYRDTWALGIHSYLSYLSERLYLCRELLADTGSLFLQINQENLHLAKSLLAEVFGAKNEVAVIAFTKTSGFSGTLISSVCDYVVWFAKDRERVKYHQLLREKRSGEEGGTKYRPVRTIAAVPKGGFDPERLAVSDQLTSQGETASDQAFTFEGRTWRPPAGLHWKTTVEGLKRLAAAGRIIVEGNSLRYLRFLDDFPMFPMNNLWTDVGGIQSRTEGKLYSVQTAPEVIERCILMTSDPGDVIFDPTCGSGTTAASAEGLGRRWITCDTSRVAINIARKRLLSATFDHYRTRNGVVASGFQYKTVNRITLRTIAYALEPEKIELVDQPEIDPTGLRVTGPFEVMSIGRYSIEDWKGYLISEAPGGYGEPAKLQNYIDVICKLYRKDAGIQGATGLLHAVVDTGTDRIGISVGPLSGRVTAKQINDVVQDALASGILEVHVLGWSFEANVGEVKSRLESRGKVKIELIMIRPDTLAEGLKVTRPESLFSPLALPDIQVKVTKKEKGSPAEVAVELDGVAVFDRKQRRTEYKRANSGYVSAWYLDEDYDGDCFVDCQMFFDFKKASNLNAEVNLDEFKLQTSSQPFAVRNYKRIAVKVVDVYGNESTVVRELS